MWSGHSCPLVLRCGKQAGKSARSTQTKKNLQEKKTYGND